MIFFLYNRNFKITQIHLISIIQVSRRGFEMESENYEKAELGEALKRSQNL